MDNNIETEKDAVKKSLEGELYFQNPTDEYNYFLERMEAIAKYSNEFFRESAKEALISRYIKALAMLREENEFDSVTLSDVYYDILNQLGIDSYCVEKEIDNYIKIHDIDYSKKENIIVSNSSKR